MVSADGSYPGSGISGLPYQKTGQANELNGWIYLPRQREALTPTPDIISHEKLTAESLPNSVSDSVQDGFHVFDQTRNSKILIFGSVIGSSAQNLNVKNQTPFNTSVDPCGEEWVTKRDVIYQSKDVIADGLDENQEKTDEESEMHEDTEELDDLLYSDGDSDFDEDDEEVSTGHYLGEFTEYDSTKQQEIKGSEEEEVASSIGTSTRKRKMEEKLVMDTASSVKPEFTRKLVDHGISSCTIKCKKTKLVEEDDSFPSNKRLKREKIHEAVRILKCIIPGGGKGKDAVFVLDEAIRYLRSMKAQT